MGHRRSGARIIGQRAHLSALGQVLRYCGISQPPGLIASGFSYAPSDLEALGMEVVWFCEVGPAFYRCKKLYPNARAFYGFEYQGTVGTYILLYLL